MPKGIAKCSNCGTEYNITGTPNVKTIFGKYAINNCSQIYNSKAHFGNKKQRKNTACKKSDK
jgi:hypothetical protein